jgi:hypothetical protein
MYGDGNATKIVKDVMNSTNQVVNGVKEATGLDITGLISSLVSKKAGNEKTE